MKEYDAPISLLENKQGYFYKLIESHGPAFFEEMKTLALNKDLDVYWYFDWDSSFLLFFNN